MMVYNDIQYYQKRMLHHSSDFYFKKQDGVWGINNK